MNKSKAFSRVLSLFVAFALVVTSAFVAPTEAMAKGTIKAMDIYDGTTVVPNKGAVDIEVVKGSTTPTVKTLTVMFEELKGEPTLEVKKVKPNSKAKKMATVELGTPDAQGNPTISITVAPDAKNVKKNLVTVISKDKNKKGKVIKKKFSLNIKEIESVKVESVTLNNTTPKVGDTITATVAPSNATNVASYAWSINGTAVEGATEATFAVPATANVGDVISVVVTDVDGKTFEPTEKATVQASEEELAVVSAEQSAANAAKVTFNRALKDDETIKVTRGTSEIAISAKANEGAVYTLTFASTLVKDTYTVVVTDANKKETKGTFEAKAQELTKINWLSDTLNVKSNTAAGMQEVATYVKGEDQWGNEMAINGATWTASTGTPSYNAQTGKLTITHTQAYNIGSTVTVICVVQDKAIAENHNYTVGMANSIASLELGEMTTDNATYKDFTNVTEKALENGSYYIPVTAKDAAGVELTESDLTAMLGSTLFVTPDNTARTGVLYFNGFTTKNGKPVMKVAAGTTCTAGGTDFDLVADMPTVLSVLSTGAAGSVTKNITIYRSPVIKDMTINLPSDLYAGKKSEFTVTATDQDGKEINMYDYAVAGAALTFADGTTLTTTNGTIAVTKDRVKKTVKFEVTPNGTAAGLLSITGTTKGLGSVIVNAQYQASRNIDSVSSLNKNIKTNIMANAAQQQMGKPVLSWNDGVALTAAEMTNADTTIAAGAAGHVQALKGPLKTGSLTVATDDKLDDVYVADTTVGSAATGADVALADLGLALSMNNVVTYAYAYTLSDSDYVAFYNDSPAATAADGTATANALYLTPVKAGSATLTTHLYKLTSTIGATGTGGTVKVEEINTLKTDITVEAEKAGKYTLEVEQKEDKSKQELYVGSTTDSLKLTLTTASGAKANQDLLKASNVKFSCEDTSMDAVLALTASSTQPTVTVGTAATNWGKNKTTEVTVTATIAVDGDTEVVTATIPVTTVAPKAVKVVYYEVAQNDTLASHTYASHAADTAATTRERNVAVGKIATTLHDIYVVDQYGNDITVDAGAGAAATLTVVNVKLNGATAVTTAAADQPTVAWDGTDKALIAITDSTTNLAAGDTFQIIVSSGTVSETFYITIV